MFHRLAYAFVLLACVGSPLPAAAEHRVRQTTTLEITAGKPGTIADKTAAKVYALDPAKNLFIVHRDVATTIAVMNTNPLLFDYSAGSKSEESPDHTAALAFAGVLQKLLDAFPRSEGGDVVQPTIDGFSPVDLREQLTHLADEIEKLPTYLRWSIGGAGPVKQLQAAFADKERRTLPDLIDRQYAAMLAVARRCLGAGEGSLVIDGHVTVDCDAPYLLALPVAVVRAQAAFIRADERKVTASEAASRATTHVHRCGL